MIILIIPVDGQVCNPAGPTANWARISRLSGRKGDSTTSFLVVLARLGVVSEAEVLGTVENQ